MAVTPTYVPLATLTLTATDNSIVFSSIPATYRDLILTIETIAGAQQDVRVRLNSDTGSNYPVVMMRGGPNGAESSALTENVIYATWSAVSSGAKAFVQMQLMDYAQTDKHKTVLIRNAYTNPSGAFTEAHAIRWANTNAVNTISVFPSTGSFAIGSTFSLFGVN